jgi:hypothetical protein
VPGGNSTASGVDGDGSGVCLGVGEVGHGGVVGWRGVLATWDFFLFETHVS